MLHSHSCACGQGHTHCTRVHEAGRYSPLGPVVNLVLAFRCKHATLQSRKACGVEVSHFLLGASSLLENGPNYIVTNILLHIYTYLVEPYKILVCRRM